MNIRTLIVDDEPLAREGVALRLAEHNAFEIVAETGTGTEAIALIKQLTPDLVFLDVNMPKLSGFDVIKAIGADNMPLVVFLTAYDEFAVKAFQVNALDYLLKPINSHLFEQCVNRIHAAFDKQSMEEKTLHLSRLLSDAYLTAENVNTINAKPNKEPERLVIRAYGHVYFVKPNDILWVEAYGDYINIHTQDKKHMVRDTMINMEKRLCPLGFQRIHRSAIVQLNAVQELISSDSGEYDVVLTNEARIKLSRSYRDELFERLKSPL